MNFGVSVLAFIFGGFPLTFEVSFWRFSSEIWSFYFGVSIWRFFY